MLPISRRLDLSQLCQEADDLDTSKSKERKQSQAPVKPSAAIANAVPSMPLQRIDMYTGRCTYRL
jgi:hypothetical protein